MSIYIDRKYLSLVSPKLSNFKQKTSDLYNFSCPFCGDSLKKKTKARGYIYKKGNGYFYMCHNCSHSTTFYKFLEYVDAFLAKEYSLESYTSDVNKHTPYKKPEFNFKKPVFKKKTVLNIPSISELSDNHFAKQYIVGRKIPKGHHKDLFYAKNFKEFILSIKPDYQKELIDNEERIVIPFRNENGDLFAVQGRALNKNPLRYITVKLDDTLKVFGLDRVNKKEKILVVEGPLDSLFLKNSIATADANLMVAEFLGKENLVLVNDNEPRNLQIVKQIKRYIDNGFNICLLPESFPGKDINEAVLKGMSKPEIQRIISNNTFNGLRATMEYNKWKKC